MELYILRHAIAEERDNTRYADDSQRPLTPKGIKRMRRVAEGLLALECSFDVIYTSPFARAKRTAQIVAETLGATEKLRETDALATDGDPKALINLINSGKDEFERVMIVGHEPYLGELISVLLSGDENLLITMKKGGVCKLRVDTLSYSKCASLEWHIPPGVAVHLE
ncbi:MAG: phosphohistidine phosphatase SixA [Ignavibacteriae bacterium]|nr:phosphohistidine phosphatase SixA [Ignavibacteriota bacterium]